MNAALLPLALLLAAATTDDEAARDALTRTAPPAEYGLAPAHVKHVSVGGFPIVGSERVPDEALFEAAFLVGRMLADRDDVKDALVAGRVRFVVMAHDEMTTDVPEHADLAPAVYWDRRARGLGATRRRPAVSCGAENLLGYPGDPYSTENILIHEFAHAMHEMGLALVDPTFDERLEATFRAAMEAGLWKDKYAATNRQEYWAEGVQSFFDTNRQPDHDHNHVDTREELLEYDPALHALIAESLRAPDWRYVHPRDRSELGHLATWDFDAAPRFVWPEGLEAAYREHLEEERARRAGDR